MTSLLSIGTQAMFANQAALQTIGQNISNANTPGYSRQQVVLTTPPGQYSGSGYFGRGVTVQTVTRAHDDFLTNEAASTAAVASADSTRQTQLTALQQIFPTDASGLGAAANTFFNSMVDVTSAPSDPSARQVVLGSASDLATRYASAGQQLQDLQSGVVSEMTTSVGTVNQLATQIAAANAQVSAALGNGQPPNDLLDQRDQLISQLSQYVQVTTIPASDGSLGVFIGGGQRLVLGSVAQQLSVTPNTYDSNRANLSISEANGTRTLDPSVLSGGSLSALIQFQNTDLQDARNYLGQQAAALSYTVNNQQALGLDLSNPSNPGAPMFSVGGPVSLPASTNAKNPDGSYVAGVQMTVVDGTKLQASSYTLASDPNNPGGYLLTRLSDNKTQSVTDGSVVDGFQINFNPAAPAQGDTFLLEPVAQAAAGMKSILTSTNGIAAASPITGSVGVNNTGTATVDSLYAVNSTLNTAQAPMTITFGTADPSNANSLQYTITMADGSTANGVWTPGQPIGNDPPTAVSPVDLGFQLSLDGVPKTGDTVTISPTQFPGSNNGNSKAFTNLQTTAFVGQQLNADGSTAPGATISNAYDTAMSDIGARLQGATYLSGVSTASATNAKTALTSEAGVNLDEEAARMMQFQQGYQASARVLQTAQTLFDELLKIAGG